MSKEELRRLAETKIQLKDHAPERMISLTAKEAIRQFIFENKLAIGPVPIKARLLYELFSEQFEDAVELRGINYSFFVNELLSQFPSTAWNVADKTFSLNTNTHPILKDQEVYAKEKHKEKALKSIEARRQKKVKEGDKTKKKEHTQTPHSNEEENE